MSIQKRLFLLKDEKGLNNSEFADLLDIPAASLSHIKSGRNKVSLDVVYKVLEKFPGISSDWLLFGKENKVHAQVNPATTETVDTFPKQKKPEPEVENVESNEENELICLFADGSFKKYRERK